MIQGFIYSYFTHSGTLDLTSQLSFDCAVQLVLKRDRERPLDVCLILEAIFDSNFILISLTSTTEVGYMCFSALTTDTFE